MVPESVKQRGGCVSGGSCASGGAGLGGLFPEALSSRRRDRSPSLPWTGARVVSSSGLSPAGKSCRGTSTQSVGRRTQERPDTHTGLSQLAHLWIVYHQCHSRGLVSKSRENRLRFALASGDVIVTTQKTIDLAFHTQVF